MSNKAVVVLTVALFLVGILICSSVTTAEAVPRSGTDREGMECETNPVLRADGTQTGLSVFSCCWHEYVTTVSGRVDNGEWCQDCNLGYDGNVQSCGDEYPARKFSLPGGSVLGHLPTENAPPNDNTTGPSHGGIINVPPGITSSLPISKSNITGSSATSHHTSTHTESSSSTGQAEQSSNHHNKGGNQGQESGSTGGSSKDGSNSDTNSGNSNSNDKSKSKKDSLGH